MRTTIRLSVFLLAGIFWISSIAGESSCYNEIDVAEPPPPIKRGLLVLVDNTVEFDRRIQDEVFNKIMIFMSERDRPSGLIRNTTNDPKIGDGDRIIIMSFSHYGSGRFTGIRGDWRLEQLPINAGDVPKPTLRKLRVCLVRQVQNRKNYIQEKLEEIYSESSKDIPTTELIETLVRTSRELIPLLEVEEIFLLIVSDMMENSDITSFYRRTIEPGTEMRQMEKIDLIPDYPGTKIYVIGAGYTYNRSHSTKVMRKVKDFWQQYIERAGGQLCEFGAPLMFGDIGRCRTEKSVTTQ